MDVGMAGHGKGGEGAGAEGLMPRGKAIRPGGLLKASVGNEAAAEKKRPPACRPDMGAVFVEPRKLHPMGAWVCCSCLRTPYRNNPCSRCGIANGCSHHVRREYQSPGPAPGARECTKQHPSTPHQAQKAFKTRIGKRGRTTGNLTKQRWPTRSREGNAHADPLGFFPSALVHFGTKKATKLRHETFESRTFV